jgi:hypothetical protein
MPRLTNPQYLEQRAALHSDWFDQDAYAIAQLDPADQMELHAYYAHTDDLTNEQAIAHRQAKTKQDPSLPQVAGRIYAKIRPLLGKRPAPEPFVPGSSRKGSPGNIRVEARGILRPHRDRDILLHAIRIMAEDEMRKEDEDNQKAA